MSLALYRTYRPGKFADVIGQDHVTEPLMRALQNDRTHHAYLFSGPRGCGKTSSARILARSLNCAAGPTAEPCEVCDSCVALAPNGPGSLDVIELDAASNRGIDQARELRERAMYAPASSKYRIYIIDEAHQLTTEAVNALLKLVEEPPPHLKFVFATTEPEKLLGTIRSRTHHYPFRLVPTSVLQTHLARVCDSEGIAADPAALALAAKAGAGSVRDSLSVLGQLVGGAGPDGITYESAVTQLGFTADALLDDILNALPARDGSAVFKVIDQVVTAGHDPRRFATDLLERVRDLIILLANPTAAADGLVAQPADRLTVLQAQAESMGMPALSRTADLVSDGITALRGATTPRLHLELLAARLLVSAGDADPAALAARLDQIEKQLATGVVTSTPATAAPSRPAPPPKLSQVAQETVAVAPVEKVVEVVAAEPVAAPAVQEPAVVVNEIPEPAPAATPTPVTTSASLDLFTLQQNWKTIAKLVEAFPEGSKFASSLLENFGVTAINGTQVQLTTASGPLLTMLKARNVDKLAEQAIFNFTQVKVQVVGNEDASFKPNHPAPPAAENMAPKPLSANMPAAEAEPVAVSAPPLSDEPEPDDPITTDSTGVDAVLNAFGGTIIEDSE